MSTRENEHLGRDKLIDNEKVREPKPAPVILRCLGYWAKTCPGGLVSRLIRP
jgi:hypothetical protein